MSATIDTPSEKLTTSQVLARYGLTSNQLSRIKTDYDLEPERIGATLRMLWPLPVLSRLERILEVERGSW